MKRAYEYLTDKQKKTLEEQFLAFANENKKITVKQCVNVLSQQLGLRNVYTRDGEGKDKVLAFLREMHPETINLLSGKDKVKSTDDLPVELDVFLECVASCLSSIKRKVEWDERCKKEKIANPKSFDELSYDDKLRLRIEDVFSKWDVDGTGDISRAEVQHLFVSIMGEKLKQHEVDILLSSVGESKEGINKDDFVKLLLPILKND